jgi:hypothetical protein
VGLTNLPLSFVPIVLKSGSLSRLEPSGTVHACTGIALPFRVGPNSLHQAIKIWFYKKMPGDRVQNISMSV